MLINVYFSCLMCVFMLHAVFSLEKTFKTTFSLLVIHMWLCLRRLKQEGKEGVELGQYLYEIYNHDVELRVSKAGVSYRTLIQKINSISKWCFSAFFLFSLSIIWWKHGSYLNYYLAEYSLNF